MKTSGPGQTTRGHGFVVGMTFPPCAKVPSAAQDYICKITKFKINLKNGNVVKAWGKQGWC